MIHKLPCHDEQKKQDLTAIFPGWDRCLAAFKEEYDLAEGEANTWLGPLQALIEQNELTLFAPNTFVLDKVKEEFLQPLKKFLERCSQQEVKVKLVLGNKSEHLAKNFVGDSAMDTKEVSIWRSNLNSGFTFLNFVEGKSNQLARAAAMQVAASSGKAYNPLFIYGGVGLGKTHLMHAMGNLILEKQPTARVLYLHSERFVADMVRALQRNVIDEFKKFYRSLDALLIDDIQFFAGKDRSQEEFFHTFNALLEGQQQVVLTSDRYPKEIQGVEERLKSRFGWGLTVAIEPPELETRVAILLSKAEQSEVVLPTEVAFFIARHAQSNVRELEGALKRVIANAHFTGLAITLDFARESLKDLLALHAKLVTIENIQKMVAEYFKIKVVDLLSQRRTRSLARPRQVAMALAKELTNHSLPEIGDAFGGRDHATVLHACRKVKELSEADSNFADDYRNLMRILNG